MSSNYSICNLQKALLLWRSWCYTVSDHYRSISILPLISKILNKVVARQLFQLVEGNVTSFPLVPTYHDLALQGFVCFPLMSFVCDINAVTPSGFSRQARKACFLLASSHSPGCWDWFLWRSCSYNTSGDITDWPISGMQSVDVTFSSWLSLLGATLCLERRHLIENPENGAGTRGKAANQKQLY